MFLLGPFQKVDELILQIACSGINEGVQFHGRADFGEILDVHCCDYSSHCLLTPGSSLRITSRIRKRKGLNGVLPFCETLPLRGELRYIYRAMPTQVDSPGILYFIDQGGNIMYLIIALSIFALAIVLTKFWSLARFRSQLNRLCERLHLLIQGSGGQLDQDGTLNAALQVCREHNTPLGRLFETAFLHRFEERTELTRRLERFGGEVVAGLEAYMTALASVVGVAPMLGFLGTIIGLVEAFMSWETLGDQITVGVLAGGIYKAMLTTAAGLTVAIPYYLLYNHLTSRIQRLTRLTETRTEELLDALTGTTAQEALPEAVPLQEPTRHAV